MNYTEEKTLRERDPKVYRAIQAEIHRERNNLLMIASENYASRAVIEAQANVMTNKYAEGYPGARYYGGCEFVDDVERLCVDRAKKLFGAGHANVQPHSGSQANMAVYMGFLRPGDIILGMELSHGGHLTHGGKASFSGQIFRSVTYGLHPKTQRIDFDQVKRLARDHKPKLIIAGASAYPRSIDFIRFREIASDHGAYLMADMAHIAGLVAADLHPSPIHVAHFVTSTTHKTLRGPRGGLILSEARYGNSLDRALFPGTQGGPLMHIIAAKAVALEEALKPGFKEYQQRVIRNAEVLAEALLEAGFDLVTGGTDNHLILVDLTPWGITGQAAETALGRAGIVVNKNTVPFDRRGPQVTSGLRLGTPALTTRGMNEKEMALVAGLITEVLRDPDSGDVIQRVRSRVSELCLNFPIYDYMLTEEDP